MCSFCLDIEKPINAALRRLMEYKGKRNANPKTHLMPRFQALNGIRLATALHEIS